MAGRRKTDKNRLMEGRGTGRGADYKPWLKVREVPSDGRKHRVLGWKYDRHYVFMSDLEYYYFLNLQWRDDVIDIREQYPLLPIQQTKLIADELGIRHPAIKNQKGKEIVMTTDFIITIKEGNLVRDIVRTVKYSSALNNKRTREKLAIEEEYFRREFGDEKFDWGIVTEKQIPKIRSLNISFFYHDYFWAKNMKLSDYEILNLTYLFKNKLIQNKFDIYKTIEDFAVKVGMPSIQCLNFFKYLLIHKEILADFNKRLIKDFYNLETWLPD